MEIVPVRYQITSVVNDTVNMLSRRLEEKDLELNINADPMIPSCLFGDEVRIRQILTNLMTNAVKYTDSGSVTLGVSYKEQSEDIIVLILSVKDTGRGIHEQDKKKLFENFTRVDQVRNRNIEGTGLGLSISSQLVSMMSGTIGVESVYGEGSEFTVKIPQKVICKDPVGDFCTVHSNSPALGVRYKESFTAPEARLLVTDDNKSNLLVVQGLLKPTGIRVDTASGGLECIRRLKENRYDILLLDHMMPEMDGIQTLRKIKEENIAPGMPIIALTANAVSGARDQYLEYGFEDYLPKPIAGNSLEKMLMKLLPPELVHSTESNSPAKEEKQEEKQEEKSSDLIDRELAMSYCGDSEELYLIMLNCYLEESEDRLKKLCEFYEQKDIDNYRITAHSLKSTSLNIGAKSLSEEARSHEFAARDKNFEPISADFDNLLENYKAVLSEVQKTIKELEANVQSE